MENTLCAPQISEAIPNLRAESNSARADAVQIGIEFGYRDQRQDDCLHGARVQRCTLYEYDVTGREIHPAQVNGFTKGPHCGLPSAPSVSGAALCVESALNPPTTSQKTQKMAAMEHRKRSKAAIDMIGHCGGAEVIARGFLRR